MANVVYGGRDDVRVLGRGDLAKAGVEVEENFIFPNGVLVEVTDEVAAALTSSPELFGAFEVIQPVVEAESEVNASAEKPAEDSTASSNKRSSKG